MYEVFPTDNGHNYENVYKSVFCDKRQSCRSLLKCVYNFLPRTMKRIIPIIAIALVVSCTSTTKKHQAADTDSFPVKYENELFSMRLPEGWMVDDSGWQGLDSMQNEVDFYNPNDYRVWFHFVKTYFPIQWKDIGEATEFAKAARAISGDSVALIDEVDSAIIFGYPTSILMYANFVNNDTIIQKQYVTYIKESHTLLYFNENFLYRDWDEGQLLGDELMKNLVIKDVVNPINEKFNAMKDGNN